MARTLLAALCRLFAFSILVEENEAVDRFAVLVSLGCEIRDNTSN